MTQEKALVQVVHHMTGPTAGSSLVDSTAVFINGQNNSQPTTRNCVQNGCFSKGSGDLPQGRNFNRGLLVSK